jgi:NTE family protein
MIENIVFSGGSIRGLCFIGTIRYLQELNIIDNIKNYAGSSIGAIVSFLLILGYTHDDLYNLFMCINLDKFSNIKSENIFSFFDNYGIDNGDKMVKTLRVFLKKKLKCDDITFEDFYEKTQKNITITGSCLNNMKVEYFNKKTYPNMSVITALRISISMPILYTPVIFNEKYYVDGALTENYAIDLFENNNKKTIGFVLTSNEIFNNTIDSVEKYFMSIIWTSTAHQLKNKIEKYKDITIEINCNIDSLDFTINKEKRIEVINDGYNISKTKIDKQFSHLIINK